MFGLWCGLHRLRPGLRGQGRGVASFGVAMARILFAREQLQCSDWLKSSRTVSQAIITVGVSIGPWLDPLHRCKGWAPLPDIQQAQEAIAV